MTQDEIIDKDEVLKMARQAGFLYGTMGPSNTRFVTAIGHTFIVELEAFAKLVEERTAEREARGVEDKLKLALEALEEAHYKIEHKQDAKKREQVIAAIKEALGHSATKADPDTLHATYGGGFTNKDFENVMRLKREQQLMGM